MSGLAFTMAKKGPQRPTSVAAVFAPDSDEEEEDLDKKRKDVSGSAGTPRTGQQAVASGSFHSNTSSSSELETRQAAEKLAEWVAKHGRQFEDLTREKNPGDSPFKFLHEKASSVYQYYYSKLLEHETKLGKAPSTAPAAPLPAYPPPVTYPASAPAFVAPHHSMPPPAMPVSGNNYQYAPSVSGYAPPPDMLPPSYPAGPGLQAQYPNPYAYQAPPISNPYMPPPPQPPVPYNPALSQSAVHHQQSAPPTPALAYPHQYANQQYSDRNPERHQGSKSEGRYTRDREHDTGSERDRGRGRRFREEDDRGKERDRSHNRDRERERNWSCSSYSRERDREREHNRDSDKMMNDRRTEIKDIEAEMARSCQAAGDSVAAMEAYTSLAAKRDRLSQLNEDELEERRSRARPEAAILNETSFDRRRVTAVYKNDGRRGHHMQDFIPPEELAKIASRTGDKAASEAASKQNALDSSNIGHKLLQKMGWKEGQGLGATQSANAITAPVQAGGVKTDSAGLGADANEDEKDLDPFEAYRRRMMLGYKHRPNPLGNPRRQYY